jgi:transposase-like protein
MKYRKWDPKTKAQVVLEGLEQRIPLVDLCTKYGIRQSTYYYWLKELQAKGHKVFESTKQSKKEQRLIEENAKLKKVIAELSIDLKKTEFELKELEGDDL